MFQVPGHDNVRPGREILDPPLILPSAQLPVISANGSNTLKPYAEKPGAKVSRGVQFQVSIKGGRQSGREGGLGCLR